MKSLMCTNGNQREKPFLLCVFYSLASEQASERECVRVCVRSINLYILKSAHFVCYTRRLRHEIERMRIITICTGTNSLLFTIYSHTFDSMCRCCWTLCRAARIRILLFVNIFFFQLNSILVSATCFYFTSFSFNSLFVCWLCCWWPLFVDSHIQCPLILSGWIYIYVHWVMVLWANSRVHIVDIHVCTHSCWIHVAFRIHFAAYRAIHNNSNPFRIRDKLYVRNFTFSLCCGEKGYTHTHTDTHTWTHVLLYTFYMLCT